MVGQSILKKLSPYLEKRLHSQTLKIAVFSKCEVDDGPDDDDYRPFFAHISERIGAKTIRDRDIK